MLRSRHSPESWVDMWETEIFPASRSAHKAEGTKVKAMAKLVGRGDSALGSTTMGWVVEVV